MQQIDEKKRLAGMLEAVDLGDTAQLLDIGADVIKIALNSFSISAREEIKKVIDADIEKSRRTGAKMEGFIGGMVRARDLAYNALR